jgi:hypothetical protein
LNELRFKSYFAKLNYSEMLQNKYQFYLLLAGFSFDVPDEEEELVEDELTGFDSLFDVIVFPLEPELTEPEEDGELLTGELIIGDLL